MGNIQLQHLVRIELNNIGKNNKSMSDDNIDI